MQPTVYLDTTVPSYLLDERETLRLHIDATRKWWLEERRKFHIWISEETLNEISAGNYPKKTEMVTLVSKIPVLLPNSQILDIAKIYLDNYLMPQVLKGNALHLVYASFYKIDFLLTWNCNHLANANKRRHIRIINARLNLPTPEIITPLELFAENMDDYK